MLTNDNYSILVSHTQQVTTTRSHFFEIRSYLFHGLLHWQKFTASKTLLLSSPVFSCACSSLFSVVMSLSVFSSAGSSALVLLSAAVDWGELNVGLWSRTQHPCWQHKYTSTLPSFCTAFSQVFTVNSLRCRSRDKGLDHVVQKGFTAANYWGLGTLQHFNQFRKIESWE